MDNPAHQIPLPGEFSNIVSVRAEQRYLEHDRQVAARADRVFAVLMFVQWIAAIATAIWISPRTWIGASSQVHIHVLGAILIGGAISVPFILVVRWQPGEFANRYLSAVGQMLFSVLLIHLSGGRIETHFHVFGSLAFLALYRDWTVLVLATIVIALDHMLRGIFWPESVFGVSTSSSWRWIEHACWVLFEDSVLVTASLQKRKEMRELASRWAHLSVTKDLVDAEVRCRVAELEQSEQKMRENSLRTRRIIDMAYDAFVVLDPDGRIKEWSSRATALFGWIEGDAIGRNINQLLDLPEMAGLFTEFGFATNSELPGQHLESTAKHRDGRFVPVEASISFTWFGDEPCVNVFFHDITRRKDLQTQLLLAQKMQGIGQLAAGIAHEINTPAQYVGDNARFLQDSFRDIEELLAELDEVGTESTATEPTWKERAESMDLPYLRSEIPVAIEQTLDGIQRITQITRAMKEFSHPGRHVKESASLCRIIENSVAVCRNEWKYVAEVKLDFDPDLNLLHCLPGELSQVLVNLIVNAAQAIGDAPGRTPGRMGTITVRTRRLEDWAEIAVADDGPGIPPEILQRVFEPFFTTKEVGKGTGQGLAIAHSVVVEKHRGTISVASEVGIGTTFALRLPLAENTCDVEREHEANLVR